MFLQVIITIGAAQALNLALLAILKKKRLQSDYLLSLELVSMFVIIMLFNYKAELSKVSLYFPLSTFVLAYLAVPLFYLYTKSMIYGKLDFRNPGQWIHFLPLIAAAGLYLYFFVPLSSPEKLVILDDLKVTADCPLWVHVLSYGLFLFVFPAYLFKSFRLLKAHESFILTEFSYTEDVSLSWLFHFLISQTIVWLAFLSFEVVGNGIFHIFSGHVGYQLGFLFMIGSIFLQGYYGLRRGVAFITPPQPEVPIEPEIKYQRSGLNTDQVNSLNRELADFMAAQKPFLEPKITIGDLAQRIGWQVNDLSRVINEGNGQNFFDFINSYRVEEFKFLLTDPGNHQYTLLSLAYDAGFNSKSTFNAIFKKFTGKTPSEYARGLRFQQAS